MAANPREARRRRIMERGSDRLALITGQIQTLPLSSASPSPFDESKDSSPQPLISNQQDLRPRIVDQPTGIPPISLLLSGLLCDLTQNLFPRGVLFRENAVAALNPCGVSHDKDKLVSSTLQHKDPQISARSSAYYGTSTAPLLSKSNEIETAVASTPEDGGRAPSRSTPSQVAPSEGQDSSLSKLGREQYSTPKLSPLRSFSLNELSSAISDSEKIRLCFSAIIAFLVVASYVGFPFLGQSLMRNVFGSRPLYLVLLTNLTVVLGRLLFTKQKGFRASDGGKAQVTPPEEQSSVEQIGKILEAGFVAQKAMGAIFMDCSVFAVIVVSGLSFVQRL